MDPIALTKVLLEHQSSYSPVMPFDPSSDKLLPLDFTAANTALTDELLRNEKDFTSHIRFSIESAGARYGIGGYAEHRTVYRISAVFDGSTGQEEPRRLHLGTDIWGPVGTPVMAPWEGRVHSFAFNDHKGDYGATIILQHEIGSIRFYTLYGHLSLSSLEPLHPQTILSAGTVFASLGDWHENGGWPPHLHFQIILDMGDYAGDYPGVCRYSEKEYWLKNSPDPDLILQLNQYIIR